MDFAEAFPLAFGRSGVKLKLLFMGAFLIRIGAAVLVVGLLAGCNGSKNGRNARAPGKLKSAFLRNPNINIPIDPARARAVTYSRVSVNGPYIAMTFDDGPHPVHTPRLLDLLKKRNIRATFYVVGTNAKRYPHILRRMVAEGHEIGNHTVTHKHITKINIEQVRQEVMGAQQAIIAACGVKPRTFRPPGGHTNDRLKVWLYREFGYSTIMWAVDPQDWKRPGPAVVANRIISNTSAGSIILAHDIHAPTIAAMPQALDGLLTRGYRFVTVSQLIALESRGVASTAGL